MLNRRRLLGLAGAAALGLTTASAGAAKQTVAKQTPAKTGGIDPATYGVRPGATDDQSKAFAKMLKAASDANQQITLPPGSYIVSGLVLPPRVRLGGTAGATRLIHGGGGPFISAENVDHVAFSGLVFDGANQYLGESVSGLLDLRSVKALSIDDCQVNGASKNGIALQRAAGRIERCTITGAADAGLWSVDAAGLAINANVVNDCANGGILVHRWQVGEDGTMVSGNRIARIGARNGGTGQNGNGINVFRAGGVLISSNIVSDCAFSAIRANSGSNVQIIGNSCLRSGETALYAEFAFEGAAIANNVIDGAANGISVVNFNEGGRMATCSGNIVRNLSTTGPYPAEVGGFGIGIGVEADTTVTGNVVEEAPQCGMQLGWGPYLRNVVATGNVVRKAGIGIAVSVVDGAGPTIITDNVLQDVLHGAIIGKRWAEPVTADLAEIGNAGYAHLTVERNRVS
ncbi:TIGR03808 family TAT-translocated repetitive protein [Mesorhizobium retamae]|uniref:TIGR03808 family TAT-translocated repetitive protein n=1 Tax=Mesorhizobium retamae TaxID=2912854 RepID=A0ABS9QJ18_9HYPH|nr:TIGR03808 family TAT-translocated repetitive protein [Mesorhizobium sp. IRAMC:0171]MCG7507402.1 TIGR03808 family TAT-translocated repetitive protein [Mesorhizobium sp. IRAMC:0171]